MRIAVRLFGHSNLASLQYRLYEVSPNHCKFNFSILLKLPNMDAGIFAFYDKTILTKINNSAAFYINFIC